MLFSDQWIPDEIKEEIKKYLETNKNKSTTVKNLWETAKAVLRGTFIAYNLPQEIQKNLR